MTEGGRRTMLSAMAGLGVVAAASAKAQGRASRGAGGDAARRLDVLESRAAMSEVLLNYARGIDRVDEALVRSCFWPESTHKHGGFEGSSSDFVNFAMKIVRTTRMTAHHISNISVQVKGDRGLSECYYLAHHRRDRKAGGGEEDALFEGRYLDLFQRRAGVWKIIRRRGLADWTPAPIPASQNFADWPAGQHSLRAPDDEYYKMLAAFAA